MKIWIVELWETDMGTLDTWYYQTEESAKQAAEGVRQSMYPAERHWRTVDVHEQEVLP